MSKLVDFISIVAGSAMLIFSGAYLESGDGFSFLFLAICGALAIAGGTVR